MMWRTIRRNVLKEIVHHFALVVQRPVSRTRRRKKREKEYEHDQQNRALDAAACDDVKKYIKSCKKRNRLSQL